MLFGDTSRVDRPFAKDPAVVHFAGKYFLYYSIPAGHGAGWGIGIATSSDLVSWNRLGSIPPESAAEQRGFCSPGARVLDGKVQLFYQTYGDGSKDAICHATSADGVHFQRDPTNPVFHPTGDWTSGRAIDAEIIEFSGKLFLYCATRDRANRVQMLCGAVADRHSDFGRASWKPLADGPILRPELPWEKTCIEAPAACVQDGRLFLFYGGAYNNSPQQIGCAVSTDGIHFRRLSDQPFLPNGPPGAWNSSESGHPFCFTDDDRQTYLFYQGNNDNGKTWWLSFVKIGWRGDRPFLQP